MISLLSYIWNHPSNRRARLRALGRAGLWQAYKRLTGGFWDVQLTPNRVLRCHPHNTSASCVLYAGLFDYPEMHFLLRYLRPADNFLDVGANVGVYTVLASSVVTNGVIHAIEPSTQARCRLEENIRINRLTNVQVHPVAASNAPGTGWLTSNKDAMNHLVMPRNLQDEEQVVSARLDDEVGCTAFALGKMDIEGAELQALRGAESMLASKNPPVWLLEIGDLGDRFGYTKHDVIQFLEGFGYYLASYDADTNRLRPSMSENETIQNVIFIAQGSTDEVEHRLQEREHSR
jgi:FkbM family methyltransferase